MKFSLSLAALGTAFYMWRLYFLVFGGTETRCDDETRAHIHESPWEMTVPLVVLALLTIDSSVPQQVLDAIKAGIGAEMVREVDLED